MTSLIPKLIEPIGQLFNNIESRFRGNNEITETVLTRALGYTEEDYNNQTTILEKLGQIIGSGINRLIDKLDLLFEDRATAVKQIEPPRSFFDKDQPALSIGKWIVYLGKVLSAGLGGSKATIRVEEGNLTSGALELAESAYRHNSKTGKSGETIIKEDKLSSEDIKAGNIRNVMRQEDWNPITGGVKANVSSQLALSGTIASMAGNTAGIGYSSTILSLMSKAKKSITEDRGLVIGGDLIASKILKAFGLELDDAQKKGYIIRKTFYEINPKTSIGKQIMNFLIKTYGQISTWGTYTPEVGPEIQLVEEEEYFAFINSTDEGKGAGHADFNKITLWVLTKKGIEGIEHSIGGKSFSFSDMSSDNINALHYSLEKNMNDGKELMRDQDLTKLQQAESIHNTFLGKKSEIDNRDDALKRATQGVMEVLGKGVEKVWTGVSEFIGGDNTGKYPNSDKGKVDFGTDLMNLYTQELASYYKARNLSDEDAQTKASMVAQWLVAQDAMESAWGNKIIGDFNYGNIKKGSSWEGAVKKDSTYNELWRSYSSPEEYIKDKISLLNNSWYHDALMADNLREFSDRLQKGKLKYSASDTKEEYYKKIAGQIDSVATRLEESKDWVDVDLFKREAEKPVTSENGEIYSVTYGNHRVRVDKNIWDTTGDPEKALQSINVVKKNGSEQGFHSYYQDLNFSNMERNVLEADIKRETGRDISYQVNPDIDYKDRNTKSDITEKAFYLGAFNDTGAFSPKARERLTYWNQYNSQHKGAWIGYWVYLTKDLKSWRRIETTCEFYLENPELGKPDIPSGKVLYSKDKDFPESLYQVTRRTKESMKNPIMAVLWVDLTPAAFQSLKDLLNLAGRNMRLQDGEIEIELEKGAWSKATGNEIIQLRNFGFIETGDDINGGSGYRFTPEYRSYIEDRSRALSQFRNSKSRDNMLSQGNTWGSNFFELVKPAVSSVTDKIGNGINIVQKKFAETDFGTGWYKGLRGETEGQGKKENNSEKGTILVNEGGDSYIDNRTTNNYYMINGNAGDKTYE